MSWLGSVTGRTAAGGWDVAVTGSGPVVAWNTSGLPLSVGDTVVLEQREPGVWEVLQRVTPHPEPVVPAKPSVSVSVPSAPTIGNTYVGEFGVTLTGFPINTSGYGNPDLTLGNRINSLYDAVTSLSSYVNALGSAQATLKDTVDELQNRVNGLRSGLSAASSAVSSVNDYTEGSANTVVAAGQAVKVAGFTVTGVRADNVAGFDSWGHDPSVELEAWLAHRVTWVKEIRAGLNRARLFRGLSAAPTLAADPAVGTTDQPWTVAVTRVQGVDSWFSTASSALVTSIGSLRSNLSLPAFNYPTVVFAWSDLGSFEASRVGLALSLMAHHTYYTAGLASAVVEAIRVVNGQ